MIEPTFHATDAADLRTLAWRWPEPVNVLSSAPVGGGLVRTSWLLNIGVPLSYARTDLDKHAGECASKLGLVGAGAALFTAADVTKVQRASQESVIAHATVGISKPTWAADEGGSYTAWRPGTINIVVQSLVPLADAAAVNAVITATEAKAQALSEGGLPGTGTASDAVAIVWPDANGDEAVQFAGPRSDQGSRIALAVHAGVVAGIEQWQG